MTEKTGMRRGPIRYGNEDLALYPREAFIKAMGYSDDARRLTGSATRSTWRTSISQV
jgi:hypothetical protein